MSDALHGTQVRQLLRLIGEARDLAPASAARRDHVLDGMCGIIGARLGALVEVDDFRPGGAGIIRDATTAGFLEAPDMESVLLPMLERGSFVEPALARLAESSGPAATRRRQELVPDGEWYRSEFVMECRRRARLDDAIFSYRARPTPGSVHGLCFNRPWGDRPFDEEERNLVQLFQEECGWLFESDSPVERAAARLSPRERDTLDRFLAGASEKEIADHLGLSAHTVHQYAKAIYRKLSVRSRGELLARFVGQ